MVLSKIAAFHEKNLRDKAMNNSKMTFLNISTSGLGGRSHPILNGVITTEDVKAVKPAIKCLTGDYYTYSLRAALMGGSSHCRICPNNGENTQEPEDIEHVVAGCVATENIRKSMLTNVVVAMGTTEIPIDIDSILQDKTTLCQFLLDCNSLNLSNATRVNINDPATTEIFRHSRKLIASIHAERLRQIKQLDKNIPT